LLTGKDATRIRHQHIKHLKFLIGQLDRLAVDHHNMGARIEIELAQLDRRHLLLRRAAHHSTHARDHLHHAEWLHEIVVGTAVKADDLVVFAALRCRHDHRHTLGAGLDAQLFQDRDPIFVRQHDIEDDEAWDLFLERGVECRAILKTFGLETGRFQRVHHHVTDAGFVFNTVDHCSFPPSEAI